MSELSRQRDAFEQILKENPRDYTTRLVFSDWLESNGYDDEAVKQRAWTPRYQDAVDWITEKAEESMIEHAPATLEDLIQAGHNYLDRGEWLWLSNESDWRLNSEQMLQFWQHFEVITGRKPIKKIDSDSYGSDEEYYESRSACGCGDEIDEMSDGFIRCSC